jgi:hypothetical protein
MTLNQLKIIGAIVVLILIGIAVERFAINKGSPEPNQVNFIHEGNVFRDNPGMKAGVWYLSYEEPGKPGLSRELKLSDHKSVDLQIGMRVLVEGYDANNVVEVTKLEILNAYKANLIWVDTPKPNGTIINPITVNGEARGSWYFEASFPIKVLDANGKLLGLAAAQAQEDWMTDNYVNFMASINYSNPTTATGTLVLEKDNPSGLPQNADELRIPIKFGTEGRLVKLYYYNENKDREISGGEGLSLEPEAVIPVERLIPITVTPIQDTIRLLINGELSDAERDAGFMTEFPNKDFKLIGANLKSDVLTLEFTEVPGFTTGGSARMRLMTASIIKTAKQFPEVKEVKFIPEEIFQP